MPGDRLDAYRAKRRFDVTPEPAGDDDAAEPGQGGTARFVIHEHDARRLHYDVRLEAGGVLVSWAVPKGPSLDPSVKRLAIHVEDHPVDYRTFEGTIPGAQYGSGTVLVWDEGTYRPIPGRDGVDLPVTEAVAAGHLSVWLQGVKLHGGWSLTRTAARGAKEQWIMVKRRDEHAAPGVEVTTVAPGSVRTGRSLAEVAAVATTPVTPIAATETESPVPAQPAVAAWLAPMLASPGDVEVLRRDAGPWQYERKLDGLRCIAVRNGDEVALWSRNHLPFTARFGGVVSALRALAPPSFVLDGELVAFDASGRSSFSLLQGPGGSPGVVYCAFDLLALLGHDTTGLPLPERQALLAKALGDPVTESTPQPTGGSVVQLVTAVQGDPAALLSAACRDGWEGLVAKRVGAPYRPGRSTDWRKLKCLASQELVVGGWTDPTRSRTGFGALLVGYWEEGELRFAGRVGTGFDQRTLTSLAATLRGLESGDAPFVDAGRVPGAHWVRPELVASVRFTEWTPDGRLRHPSFQGLRTDKDPVTVVRERAAGPSGT